MLNRIHSQIAYPQRIFYVRINNMQTLMNALRELTIVPTTVIILMATLHVVVGMAIDYLMMVTPALVSHFAVNSIHNFHANSVRVEFLLSN